MGFSNRFFAQFPTLQYDVTGSGEEKLVTDILKRIRVHSNTLDNKVIYEKYEWEDVDRVDIIAHRFYGDSQLHWVIILINKTLNPFFGFPMSQQELIKFVNSKYGSLSDIHHYENDDGFQVNSTEVGANPITNLEHETTLNDAKRSIKILKPEFITDFVKEFRTLIGR